MRLRFELTPLDRVVPWGERPVLHWFGLTDGWYSVELGGHEVLRYSERTVRELCPAVGRPDRARVGGRWNRCHRTLST
ncbi:DUF5984 family protein [Streptomyces sp. NPDC051320]|uniref:DUF5984 family protein n=1 Tax=Streptomyces sp. NPDC051320 TaxID=3154644 RepID=UPI003434B100